MGLKGWAVVAALVVLGGFLFLNHLERMRVGEVGKRKTPAEQTAAKRKPRTNSLGPDYVKALIPYKEELEKECMRDAVLASSALPKRWQEQPTNYRARSKMATAFACEALAAKDPQRCAALNSLAVDPKDEKGEVIEVRSACGRHYYNVRSVVAGIRGEPDAKDACMASFTGVPGIQGGMLGKVCDVIVGAYGQAGKPRSQFSGDPMENFMKFGSGACALAKPFAKSIGDGFMENCEAFGAGLVDPKRCNRLKDHVSRLTCIERSAAFWATADKDAKRCEGSDLCLAATTGSAERCGALRKEAASFFCRADARKKLRVMLEAELKFRWDYGLRKFEPGDAFLHRLPPEEQKRIIAADGTRRPEDVLPDPGAEARLPEA
ncbi:hypothetical protein ACFL2T_06085, partial [Elusimicrobiota bacterium]